MSSFPSQGRRVSIADVARRAGVSITTVSRVINRVDYPVSESLKARVLEAVEALQYAPNRAAQGLRHEFSNLIGLIVRDISDGFFGEIAKGVTTRAMQKGYLSFVCSTGRNPENELEYLELLWQHRVRGIVLTGGGFDTPEYRDILSRQLERRKRFGMRIVAVGSQKVKLDIVTVDYRKIVRSMTRYLIERGHERIALVTAQEKVITSQEHLEGFRWGLRQCGIAFERDVVEFGDFTERAGYEACKRLLARSNDVTAICAGSDTIAIGVIHALTESGKRVPEDISVIGIGDLPQAQFMKPPMTTVSVPRCSMGERAVDMILEESPSTATERVVFETQIIERKSVMRLPRKARPCKKETDKHPLGGQ